MAIAAAYMLWRMASRGIARTEISEVRWTDCVVRRTAGPRWLLADLHGAGDRTRVDDHFLELPPTLDGAAYMVETVHWERDEYFPLGWDLLAIRWLQDNVEGSPVVLGGPYGAISLGGRIANYTGLPTVIGWPWHQIPAASRIPPADRPSGFRRPALLTRALTSRRLSSCCGGTMSHT